MDEPTDDELAAIAAAYALLLRSAAPPAETPPSRWRRAARTEMVMDGAPWDRAAATASLRGRRPGAERR